jgi:hypothetical protein
MAASLEKQSPRLRLPWAYSGRDGAWPFRRVQSAGGRGPGVGLPVVARALVFACLLTLGSASALRGDTYPAASTSSPSVVSTPYGPAPSTPYSSFSGPNPYAAAAYPGGDTSAASQQFTNGPAQLPTQPPPGGRSMADIVGPSAAGIPNSLGRPDTVAGASDRAAAPAVISSRILEERPIESTWYYRLDSFHWNERLNGQDFVNENGPMSTIGYTRRNGQERFRFEVFGGTVAYDGGAQWIDDQNVYHYEPMHMSNGTNYFGVRGEYDLLIEPSSWTYVRLVLGAGTRFWLRDIQDGTLSDIGLVPGYQETWWTFYPYVGLESKVLDQNAFHFFGSARVGLTAFTYQYADIADPYYGTGGSVLYPRLGVTSQAELGVACRRFSLSAYTEVMTWGESAVVRDSLQPASLMLTVGARVGYTF